MYISHKTELGQGMEAIYFDNFPTVELSDGQDTLYIGSEAWPKLIEVLQKAQAAHESHTSSKE